MTVTILNDSGKDTRTEEYYRGCKLVLRARALKKFTGLYVAGVSAEGLWEGYEVRGSIVESKEVSPRAQKAAFSDTFSFVFSSNAVF